MRTYKRHHFQPSYIYQQPSQVELTLKPQPQRIPAGEQPSKNHFFNYWYIFHIYQQSSAKKKYSVRTYSQ